MPDLRQFVDPLRDWALLAGVLALPMLLLAVGVMRRHGALLPPRLPKIADEPSPEPVAEDAITAPGEFRDGLDSALPDEPFRRIEYLRPLHGGEVLAAFLLSTLVVILVATFLQDLGLITLLCDGAKPDTEVYKLRHGLWSTALALPLQVIAILVLVRRSRPAQFGWTAERSSQNALVGFLYWLLLMPGVLWFNLLVSRWYERLSETEPEQHAIQKLVETAGTRPDWVLAVLTAVVAAPVLEELLYRGLLQSWLTRDGRRGDIIVTLTFALSLIIPGDAILKAVKTSDLSRLALELQPMAFVLGLLPIYVILRWRGLAIASGIFAGALFFAMVHASVWPSPVPLLPLGLTLGYLAWRTRSLVGPIVLHALFNSVAMLGLLHHDAAANGSAVTSTSGASAASTRTFVPGASLPRRK